MIQYLIAGLVGGAVALAQKPKKMERGGRLDEEDIKDRLYDMGVDYEDLMENAGLDLDAIQDQYLGFVYDPDTNTWGMGYAKGGMIKDIKVNNFEDLHYFINQINSLLPKKGRGYDYSTYVDYSIEDTEDGKVYWEAEYIEDWGGGDENVLTDYGGVVDGEWQAMTAVKKSIIKMIGYWRPSVLRVETSYAKGGETRTGSKDTFYLKGVGRVREIVVHRYIDGNYMPYTEYELVEDDEFAKGGVNDGSDEMLFVKEDDESMELYIFKNANGNYTWRILYDGEIQEQGSEPTKSEATSACIEALGYYRVRYAKGGRVSTYEYKAGRNPKRPFDVLGRKDGMVMYHTSRASVKDSADKAEELLENGYDEVLIAQP